MAQCAKAREDSGRFVAQYDETPHPNSTLRSRRRDDNGQKEVAEEEKAAPTNTIGR